MISGKWRFGRFSLVGFMGAVLQLMLLSLLMNGFGLASLAATPIAIEITILHNFIWHERFTWSGLGPKTARHLFLRLLRFHASNGLISLAGNTILTYCLVERLKAPVLPTAVGAMVLCSLANFLTADRWVYRRPREPSSDCGDEMGSGSARVNLLTSS